MSRKTSTSSAPQRIAKVMARAGVCSRREAERWIAAGRVAVNGETLTTPAVTVTAEDRIVVDGKPLPGGEGGATEKPRVWRYHKPAGLLTTHRDPEGRPTVFDALPPELPRVISVGRLDLNSEGLLLLTTHGGLARHLELPATGWRRRYRVRARGRPDEASLDRLREGMTVDGVRYAPLEVALDRQQGANCWLTFGLREGKNREIRLVCEAVGLTVNRLIRTAYGPFQLGNLRKGAFAEVPEKVLREQVKSEWYEG